MRLFTRTVILLCATPLLVMADPTWDAMGNYTGDYDPEGPVPTQQAPQSQCLNQVTQESLECEQISRASVEFCQKQSQPQKPSVPAPGAHGSLDAIATYKTAMARYREALKNAKEDCEQASLRCANACDDSHLNQCRSTIRIPDAQRALSLLQSKMGLALKTCLNTKAGVAAKIGQAIQGTLAAEAQATSSAQATRASADDAAPRNVNKSTCTTADCMNGTTAGADGGGSGGGSGGSSSGGGFPGDSSGSYSDSGSSVDDSSGSTEAANNKGQQTSGMVAGLAGLAGQFLNPAGTNAAYQNPAELAGDHCSRPENMSDPICLCRGGGASMPQCQPGQMNSNSKMTFDQIASGVGGAKLQKPNGKTTNGDSLQFPGSSPDTLAMGVGKPAEPTAAAAGYGGGGSGLNTNKVKPSAPDEAPAQGSSLSANILMPGKGGSGYGGGSFRGGGLNAPRTPEGLPGYNLGLPKQQERPNLQAFRPVPGSRAQGAITGTASFASTAAEAGSIHPASMVIWKPMSVRYQSLNHTLIP